MTPTSPFNLYDNMLSFLDTEISPADSPDCPTSVFQCVSVSFPNSFTASARSKSMYAQRFYIKSALGAREMAQQARALAAQARCDLSSVLSTQIKVEEETDPTKLSSDLHTCTMTHTTHVP